MATTITISTDTQNGALVSSRSTANDAKAQQVFSLVAEHIWATGTAQQRLDAVLDEMIRQLVLTARNRLRHVKALEAAAEEQDINLD